MNVAIPCKLGFSRKDLIKRTFIYEAIFTDVRGLKKMMWVTQEPKAVSSWLLPS